MVLLLITAAGLAMDSFSASIAGGMFQMESKYSTALKAGIFFGFFQGLMALIGWLLGEKFEIFISGYDHWVAFALLLVIGAKMILESFEDESVVFDLNNYYKLALLSLATSIDALIVGISLSLLKTHVVISALIIGGVTAILCFIGVLGGKKVGGILGNRATIAGGVVLMLIGVKILLSHTIMTE